MIFTEITPDTNSLEVFSMLSDCCNYRLSVYVINIRAIRIRIYTKRSNWMLSTIDWCLGTNKQLAERLLGTITKYLEDKGDLGLLDWGCGYSFSKIKPIHNDHGFLRKVLSLVDSEFNTHKIDFINI